MFTGIVEDLGIVKRVVKSSAGAKLNIESKLAASDTKIGDSISINGSCLTVIDIHGDELSFDISAETLEKTNLDSLASAERVNIERALRADSRIGGHFVNGHIDCIGKIASKEKRADFVKITIEIPDEYMIYLSEKGSIAVDGISLTINRLKNNSFSVMIIPHTISVTSLGYKKTGDSVNVEVDILAKYANRLVNRSAEQSSRAVNISKNLLKEHGFI